MGKFLDKTLKIYPKLMAKSFHKMKVDRPLPSNLIIDNKWLNKFFDKLSERLDGNQNYSKTYLSIHLSIVLCNSLNVLKQFCVMSGRLSTDLQYVVNDWTLFIGGFRTYYLLGYSAAFFWSAFLHHYLYLSSDKKLFVWRQLFDMSRGKLSPSQMGLTSDDSLVIKKYLKRGKLIFKLLLYSFNNLCEFWD